VWREPGIKKLGGGTQQCEVLERVAIAAPDVAARGHQTFLCPAPHAVLRESRKAGDSLGAMVEVVADGVPAGWGAPVYGKVDADLATAMMSINAVKGVEIGAGMQAAAMSGSAAADEVFMAASSA